VTDWRARALVPDDAEPNATAVESILAAMPAGQRVLAACRSLRFEMTGWVARMATIILTDESLIVGKDRVIGRPRADKTIPLDEITATGCGPLLGVGPTWEVVFRARHNAVASMYFPGPVPAEQVVAVLKTAVSATRLNEADPDVAEFQRGVAAGQAEPPGELGKAMTPAQIVSESRTIRRQVAEGQLNQAWARRVQLGYGVPADGIPQPDRFWLDAAPAIAGLRLGRKDHPMVPMCCGMAEMNHDPNDPEQRAAVAEFTRLFHG
jgi:hypothetical protein